MERGIAVVEIKTTVLRTEVSGVMGNIIPTCEHVFTSSKVRKSIGGAKLYTTREYMSMYSSNYCDWFQSLRLLLRNRSRWCFHYGNLWISRIQYNVRYSILSVSMNTVKWDHDGLSPLLSVLEDEKEILLSKLPFWRILNAHVTQNGPLTPDNIFWHGLKALYIWTKGGFHAETQFKEIVRSKTSHLELERKHGTQKMKTLFANGFISWRLFKCVEHLSSLVTYKSLEKFRDKINNLECLPDFLHEVFRQLFQHDDLINTSTAVPQSVTGHAVSQ